MIEIVPAILTNDPVELRRLIALCEGKVERVSIDIIDGKFANNKTIDPSVLEDIDTDLKIDFQLMVEEPVNWIERCIRGQADRIIGHVEKMTNQLKFVGQVQEVGAKVGLALDLQTPVSEIDETILTSLDVILIMSVPAGFGGQKFSEEALEKVKELNKFRLNDKTPYKIQVDGGITMESIYNVVTAGADEVSIGRRLFERNLAENLKGFQEAVHNYHKYQ